MEGEQRVSPVEILLHKRMVPILFLSGDCNWDWLSSRWFVFGKDVDNLEYWGDTQPLLQHRDWMKVGVQHSWQSTHQYLYHIRLNNSASVWAIGWWIILRSNNTCSAGLPRAVEETSGDNREEGWELGHAPQEAFCDGPSRFCFFLELCEQSYLVHALVFKFFLYFNSHQAREVDMKWIQVLS